MTRAPEDDTKALEDAQRYIAARRYILRDAAGAAHLESDAAPLPRPTTTLELHVARLSQPKVKSRWAPEASVAAIAACTPDERTAFVIFVLRAGAGPDALERSWVQHVALVPQLDDERDGALLRRVLGPAQFLEYLRGYLDPAMGDGADVLPTEVVRLHERRRSFGGRSRRRPACRDAAARTRE